VKRGVRREVMTPIEAPAGLREEVRQETQQRTLEKHSPLLRALRLAHYYQQRLDDGKDGRSWRLRRQDSPRLKRPFFARKQRAKFACIRCP
jgi:hypothetical protein